MKTYIQKHDRKYSLTIPKKIIISLGWDKNIVDEIKKNKKKKIKTERIPAEIKLDEEKGIIIIDNPDIPPKDRGSLKSFLRRQSYHFQKNPKRYRKILKQNRGRIGNIIKMNTNWEEVRTKFKINEKGEPIITKKGKRKVRWGL